MSGAPFLVLALPRSRTAWLARFLTYGDFHCAHEQARHVRTLEDVASWLSQDWTGAAETSVARWWRLARRIRPDLRIVTVRRPVEQVVESLMRLDLRGIFAFDRERLTREMERLDRALNRVEDAAGDVLSVGFDDLQDEAACRRVFEHCLPYPYDPLWWEELAPANIQTDMRALMRYAVAHQRQMAAAGTALRRQIRSLLGARRSLPAAPDADGVVIDEEPLATFRRDAEALMAEHCIAVGDPPDQFLRKNWPMMERLEAAGAWHTVTARLNGRMLGYLVSVIGPSLETPGVLTATQAPFFVANDAAGLNLGMRLQRAAVERLRQRGVTEIYLRAGVRGAGPRLGVLYRRLGAEDFGQMYKLQLQAA